MQAFPGSSIIEQNPRLPLGIVLHNEILKRSPWDLSLYLLVLQYCFYLAKKKIRELVTRNFITKTNYSESWWMLIYLQPPDLQNSFDRRRGSQSIVDLDTLHNSGEWIGPLDLYLSEYRVDSRSDGVPTVRISISRHKRYLDHDTRLLSSSIPRPAITLLTWNKDRLLISRSDVVRGLAQEHVPVAIPGFNLQLCIYIGFCTFYPILLRMCCYCYYFMNWVEHVPKQRYRRWGVGPYGLSKRITPEFEHVKYSRAVHAILPGYIQSCQC